MRKTSHVDLWLWQKKKNESLFFQHLRMFLMRRPGTSFVLCLLPAQLFVYLFYQGKNLHFYWMTFCNICSLPRYIDIKSQDPLDRDHKGLKIKKKPYTQSSSPEEQQCFFKEEWFCSWSVEPEFDTAIFTMFINKVLSYINVKIFLAPKGALEMQIFVCNSVCLSDYALKLQESFNKT